MQMGIAPGLRKRARKHVFLALHKLLEGDDWYVALWDFPCLERVAFDSDGFDSTKGLRGPFCTRL